MAREAYDFTVTLPTGTAPSAPSVIPLTLPLRQVRELEIRIPPGPRGQVGIAIGAAGNPVIPRGAGQWIVSDDEIIRWPLEQQITSGAWQLLGYNLGNYTHTVHVRFLVDLTGDSDGYGAQPLNPALLSSRG